MRAGGDLYRAFWRWHFYAGLLALPFLAWLAVTGGLYLFKPEVERAVYGSWITLEKPGPALPTSRLITAAERHTGGKVTQVQLPATTGESWRMRVQLGESARTAFVDPGSGAVLGTVQAGGIMQLVRELHSLAIAGPIGNALIEIAAGWGIVLVVTGVVLWWPRGAGPALAVRGPPRKRRFWRDLHATIGILAGGLVLFLAVTGMPWSVFWGAQVQRLVTDDPPSKPEPPGLQPSDHEEHRSIADAQRQALPWALQAAPTPTGSGHGDIGPDRALSIAAELGLAAPLTLTIPQEPAVPYRISQVVPQAQDTRAVTLEASSGRVLQDARYAEFGRGAQLMEWGIATHQGEQYGAPNRWLMLAGCAALLLLCVSAPVLWWKRRVHGRLARPPEVKHAQAGRAAMWSAGLLGILYPLTGATMLLVWVADQTFARRTAGA